MRCIAIDKGEWYLYESPLKVLTAYSVGDVDRIIEEAENLAVSNQRYAFGFVSYEAYPAFDTAFGEPSLTGLQGPSNLPLAEFFVFSRRTAYEFPSEGPFFETSPLMPEVTHDLYRERCARIKESLAKGDTYQINYTFRLRAIFRGNPLGWFLRRAQAGHGNFPSYVEGKGYAIASLSPELFFSLDAPLRQGDPTRTIRMRPMKGTARAEPDHVDAIAANLRSCPKNRAENIMITDMARNDLGRICLPGSVRVPRLLSTEIYPTVVQMTSTVEGETTEGIASAFRSLFPCASITGAPKASSVRIIDSLESSPRGIYTGAIGLIRPDGSATFSVAIRTAVFAGSSMEYGVGSGIVWDSEHAAEWDECLLKAEAAQEPVARAKDDGFYVFESLLLRDGLYDLYERHRNRLSSSLSFIYGFTGACLSSVLENYDERLADEAKRASAGGYKVRAEVRQTGEVRLVREPMGTLPYPYRISLSSHRVDSRDPLLYHKTSLRSHATEGLARRVSRDAVDVIMRNERGELTESTRANVVLDLGGILVTPPVLSGLLPGTFRARLLEAGEITERALYEDDYLRADKVFIVNSVRGWVPCERLDV